MAIKTLMFAPVAQGSYGLRVKASSGTIQFPVTFCLGVEFSHCGAKPAISIWTDNNLMMFTF